MSMSQSANTVSLRTQALHALIGVFEMPIIDLNKIHDIFFIHIRDNLNLHEKIELSRMLLSSIENDHNELMRKR